MGFQAELRHCSQTHCDSGMPMAWPQRTHQVRVSWLARWQTPHITTPLRAGSADQSGVDTRLDETGVDGCPPSGKSSCSGSESAFIKGSLATSTVVMLRGRLLETTTRF